MPESNPTAQISLFHSDQLEQDQSRAKWTTQYTKIFVDLLIEQIRQGNRPSNVFTRKAWKYVREEFNKQTGLTFDRQQLKNHLDVLRKRHNHVKALLEQPGFSWDATQGMVVATDDVWQKYIEVHPDAEAIKKKGCPTYELLCTIFSDSGTFDEKCVVPISGAIMQQMTEDQYRAKWTTPLEKIFADLMLEQVIKGNRSNSTFNKKAWKHISDEFNRKTGLNFDKQQLKNHHGVLRRSYNSIKSLLDHNGFSWDKSKLMIVAENNVWAEYIKEHPEVEAIRVKGCPVYELLDMIFSEPGVHLENAVTDLQIVTPKVHPEAETIKGKEFPIFKQLCRIFSEPEAEGTQGRYIHSSHDVELDQEGVTGETPEPLTDEASSQSTKKMDVQEEEEKKHKIETPIYAERHKRIRTETSHSPVDAILERASMTNKRACLAQSSNQFSISSCITILNDMQGVDQDLYLAALDMFQDPDRRETFISMKSDMRLAWLKSKCKSKCNSVL